VQFAEQAQSLLDAALTALERGESCQEMTVLIGRDGGIQLCTDSDWPLDSLMLDRGSRTGYRVSPRRGWVRVEGREGLRRCVLEGDTQKPFCRSISVSNLATIRIEPGRFEIQPCL
jgi:hypothetical protein